MLCAVMLLTLASGCASNSDSPAASQGTTAAATAAPAANGETANVSTDSGAFDQFARPAIKADGALKIACIHPKPEVESQKRSILQCELESKMRGWTFQDIVYDSDSECNVTKLSQNAPLHSKLSCNGALFCVFSKKTLDKYAISCGHFAKYA